ncbi:hypothetical protein SAMN05443574_103324 [Haloarcula vallismortis]|uniref:Uncharacterized protein n=2 Tax=Haloarcula vallismortis TaxID=28442 RepID=M0JRJ8_HALVA|nr:hypothetical protein [Haloarcula vallismortis]EMA11586.1 hypothetical protein C437_01700 [Haloarcula vallismortis ATCC 29715]SDW45576.1 hypothetical protein SAMN05443574_103324 [Haloarcula vallismortis]
MNGDYRIVTLHDEREICRLHDREMAEAILYDLQEGRITEEEAEKIAASDHHELLYTFKTNVKTLLQTLTPR